MRGRTHLDYTLTESVARTFGTSVQEVDAAWERAELSVRVGRTRPMPLQLHMVMRGERARPKPRTKKNDEAFERMKRATDQGKIADADDIINAMPEWTKPPPNPYPKRKIGRPVPHRLVPVINRSPAYANKPEHTTGFWTSTYRGSDHKYPSDWVEWCSHERFPHSGEYRSWVLEVEPSAFVLELDDEVACDTLFRLGYMYRDPYYLKDGLDFLGRRPQIDFEKLASVGVDGVHLTERGNHAMHISFTPSPGGHEHDFNGWDSESTIWLRWAFRRVRVGPKIKIPERDW